MTDHRTSETEVCPTCKSSSKADRKQVPHGGYGSNAYKIVPCSDYWHRIGAGIPPDGAPSMPVELRTSNTSTDSRLAEIRENQKVRWQLRVQQGGSAYSQAAREIEYLIGLIDARPASETRAVDEGFQARVYDWMAKCFMRPDSMLPVQRSFRFIEEALELVQASGTSREEVLRLVEYVYGRPAGLIAQEIGGVMVTLSGLATSFGLSMEYAGNAELARCDENTEKIRAKDLAKPQRSPLPGASEKANERRELTLHDFGYAPGNYAIKCLDCGQESLGCDKRAARCETCAKQALAENRAGLAQKGEQA